MTRDDRPAPAQSSSSPGWSGRLLRGKTWSTVAAPGTARASRRATALLASVALLGAPLTGVATAADAEPHSAATGTAATSSAPGTFIVRAQPGQVEAVAEAVRRTGGTPGRRIAILDALVADLPRVPPRRWPATAACAR